MSETSHSMKESGRGLFSITFVTLTVASLGLTASIAVASESGDSTRTAQHTPPVTYDETPKRETQYTIRYENSGRNEFLAALNAAYDLDRLTIGARDDAETTLRILHWVHSRWGHDGENTPSKNDALTILKEASEGRQFRCVEYAIVTTACLNAVGLKARTVVLYSKEIEFAPVAAAHVVTEVFLNDFGKWAFVDAQWDAMPVMNGFPLNAVEFEDAIAGEDPDLKIKSLSHVNTSTYTQWVSRYLFYLDVAFDNTQTIAGTNLDAKGKTRLMLVPLGAKEPRIFQVNSKIDNCVYTNSLGDFYQEPVNPSKK